MLVKQRNHLKFEISILGLTTAIGLSVLYDTANLLRRLLTFSCFIKQEDTIKSGNLKLGYHLDVSHLS